MVLTWRCLWKCLWTNEIAFRFAGVKGIEMFVTVFLLSNHPFPHSIFAGKSLRNRFSSSQWDHSHLHIHATQISSVFRSILTNSFKVIAKKDKRIYKDDATQNSVALNQCYTWIGNILPAVIPSSFANECCYKYRFYLKSNQIHSIKLCAINETMQWNRYCNRENRSLTQWSYIH